jgi:protein O-GlcNAc transferase
MNDLPDFDAFLTQAAAAARAGRVDQALEAYQSALGLAPTNAGLHHNVGVLLSRRGDLNGAEEHLLEAERLEPNSPASSLAVGHIYFAAGRIADAALAFERALRRAPDSIDAQTNLGLTLDALGESDRAFLQFESSAAPSAWTAATGLRWARTSDHAELEPQYMSMVANWQYELPDLQWLSRIMTSLQYFDFSRDEVSKLYRRYNTLMQQAAGSAAAITRRSPRKGDRLRIGYLSSDFRRHVMGDLTLKVFRCHDRQRVEIFAYSMLPEAIEDAWTAQVRESCDGYVSVAALGDSAAAERIAEDDLDILVDLASHTPQARPGILLRKPAPVIVAHLGDHGAIGLEQVDFKITDVFADLPDAAQYQIEKPLAMNGCLMPFRRVTPTPADPAGRVRLGVSSNAVILGVFSGALKMSPRSLGLWRRILDATPGAYLALSPFTKVELIRCTARLTTAGIPANRIVVVQPSADDAVNRARYWNIDVLLDTLPYTGGDSTVAALDMGVPVVTRAGERQAERMGLSILSHIGVTDTVAWSDDEYVAIAYRLATDPAWRVALSERILEGIASSGIADFERYTRNLEDAYERALAVKRADLSGH